MARKLILTPFEHGYLDAMHFVFNETSLAANNAPLDVPHLLLSAITMAGVDSIQSMIKLQHSQTKLVKRVVSQSTRKEWIRCNEIVQSTFDKYVVAGIDKSVKDEIMQITNIVSRLLYAMKTNSGILLLSDIGEFKNKHLVPPELLVPTEILFSSIQTKNANLPIVKYDIEKKDIRKLLEVLDSKEFQFYRDAQSEIEASSSLTTKTISSIEKAGKELYRKNSRLLDIKDSLVKAIPLTSKVVDLYFGKLPGILTEYGGKILTDYLGLNKTIPIYKFDAILNGVLKSRLESFVKGSNGIK